jgi:hypothetical protein
VEDRVTGDPDVPAELDREGMTHGARDESARQSCREDGKQQQRKQATLGTRLHGLS